MNHLNHFLVQQQYEAAINTNYVTGPASNFYVSELYWRNSLHPSFMSLITGRKVSAKAYYSEYHGHRVNDLEKVLPALRAKSSRLIWTAGDSSLDNKYWVEEQAGAVGAYKDVLEPAVSKKDVTYWLNYHCHNSKNNSPRKTTAAINTAVEATTLNERTFQLRPQDIFIRDNIQAEDVLIVSIGGNDIAMMPTPCTIASIGSIVCMPRQILQNGFSFGYFPADDWCCGCGPSCWSCACSCPPCLGYFRHLFQIRVQHYLRAKTKPAKILICMIYYPDERNSGGWASRALNLLGYDKDPEKIQLLIRKAYYEATSLIRVPGVEVIPVPLYNALDGKDTTDYVVRVEPSAKGGRKMAEYLLDIIDNPSPAGIDHPTTSRIEDRQ